MRNVLHSKVSLNLHVAVTWRVTRDNNVHDGDETTKQTNRLRVGCASRVAIETAAVTVSDDCGDICAKFHFLCSLLSSLVGCVAQLVERRSLAGQPTLSCARPAADR